MKMWFGENPERIGQTKDNRERCLKDFKIWLQVKGRKPRTVDKTLNDVYRIIIHTESFTKECIDSYFSELTDRGCKNTYINGLIGGVRVYSQFAGLGEDLLHWKFRVEELSNISIMSDDEIESFVNMELPKIHQRHRNGTMMLRRVCSQRDWDQWSLFWKIMAFTGMRPGEVAALKARDCDFGRDVFTIEDMKTNTYLHPMKHFEHAPMAPNIKEELIKYLDDRNLGENDILFPARYGGNKKLGGIVDSVAWGYSFHKRLSLLKVHRPSLRPYSLRHSMATSLLETDGVDIVDTMKIMRHKDIKTTLIYEHLTTKDLLNTVKKLPLIRKGSDPKNILQLLIASIKSFQIDRDERFDFGLEEKCDAVNFYARIIKTL